MQCASAAHEAREPMWPRAQCWESSPLWLAALDPADVAAARPYAREMSRGVQHFSATGERIITDPVQGPFNVEGGVGKPVKHAAADLHVTGEAMYVSVEQNSIVLAKSSTNCFGVVVRRVLEQVGQELRGERCARHTIATTEP